jgi:ATP-dependent RNA helicase DeaD
MPRRALRDPAGLRAAYLTEKASHRMSEAENINDETGPEVVEPEDSLPELTIDELPDALEQACRRAGWNELMRVQKMAMPYMLAERDLMVQSRTGSGKTGAFVLPMLDRIDTSRKSCQALVLAPTRELARQVAGEVETLAGPDGPRSVAVYGGVSYGPQIDAFRKGAHIVAGTPGRILDHLLKKNLRLDDLRILVFDEADRMMGMGFYPDMKKLQRYVPDEGVNAYMFSATFPPRVMRIAHEFLEDPEVLSLSSDHVHVTEVDHVFYRVRPEDKDRALVRIIEIENPERALIFCNTRRRVHYVKIILRRFGIDAEEISSDLSQKARERVLGRLRSGNLRFLVATDVAARGIDIPELSHVFQYETPEDTELYVHRAGRTGRAGASGEAVTLVGVLDKLNWHRIVDEYEIDVEERPLPSDEDVQEVMSERLTNLLEARLREKDQVEVERMGRFEPLARELAESESELIAMLLEEAYERMRGGRPEPEEQAPAPEPEPKAGRKKKRKKKRPSSKKPRAAEATAEEPKDKKPKVDPAKKRYPRKRRKK